MAPSKPDYFAQQQEAFRQSLKRKYECPTTMGSSNGAQDKDLASTMYGDPVIIYATAKETIDNLLMSEVATLVSHIKQMEVPVKTNVLQSHVSKPIDGELMSALRSIPRLRYNVQDDTFEYVNTLDIKSKQALLSRLRSKSMEGLSYRRLRDGWRGAAEAINQLEQEGEVLVLRAKDSPIIRRVWHKGYRYRQMVRDNQFLALPSTIETPKPGTLPGLLAKADLPATGTDPVGGPRKRKRIRKRKDPPAL